MGLGESGKTRIRMGEIPQKPRGTPWFHGGSAVPHAAVSLGWLRVIRVRHDILVLQGDRQP